MHKADSCPKTTAYPEAAIREGADELTLRADEVGTLKAFINVTTVSKTDGSRRWLIMTGMPSAKASTKE